MKLSLNSCPGREPTEFTRGDPGIVDGEAVITEVPV